MKAKTRKISPAALSVLIGLGGVVVLALVLPSDVWLDHLTVSSPTVAPTGEGGAPTGFDITGRAFSHEGVARLLSRLQVLPDLSDVTLHHSRTTSPGNQNAPVEFKIVASIRSPEAAS